MKIFRLLLTIVSLYLLVPTQALAEIECGGQDTPSCSATKAKFVRGVPGFFDCPGDSFRDPIKGGQCWECPAGMERSWKPVTDKDAACLVPSRSGLLYKPAVEEYSSSFSCPAGSFYDPRNGGECWTCPADFKRTAHAVDKYNACYKANNYSKPTKHDLIGCPSGTFKDPRKGGECWSCPRGYRRTAHAVTHGRACVAGDVFNLRYKSATYHQKHLNSCPSGQIKLVGSRQCFSCPSGYEHDILITNLNSDKACFAKANQYRRATLVRGCDAGKGQFVDPLTTNCYSCPAGYIRSLASVKSDKACVSNATKVAPAEFVSQWGCDESKGEIWDPKNTSGSKLGTCWECPSQYSRSMAAVDAGNACKSNSVRWKNVPYNDPGMLGLVHYGKTGVTTPFAEAIAEWLNSPEHLTLITDYMYTAAEVQGKTTAAEKARFVADEWQKIRTNPQESSTLYGYALGILRTTALKPTSSRSDLENRMIASFERYMHLRQIYVAEQALTAYNAWVEAIEWQQSRSGTMDSLFGDDYPPPDFQNIAQQTLHGGVVSAATLSATAGFSSWALSGGNVLEFSRLSAISEKLFPNRVVEDGLKKAVAKSIAKSNIIATVGPQVVVSVAIIMAEVRMNQVIEATQAEEKLTEAVAHAKDKNNAPDLAKWVLDDDKGPVIDKYWSLLSQGKASQSTERRVLAAAQSGYAMVQTAGFNPDFIGQERKPLSASARLVQVQGKASDVSISPDGKIWVVGTNNAMYQRDTRNNRWNRANGEAKSFAAGAGDDLWHTSLKGDIYRGDGKRWQKFAGRASAVFAGPGGEVWHTQTVEKNNGFHMFRLLGNGWRQVRGEAIDVAFGAPGTVWHMGKNGAMYKSTNYGGNWSRVNGEASSIAVAGDGVAWHLSKSITGKGGHSIYRSIDDGKSWQKVPGHLVKIAAGPNGMLWGIDAQNQIFELKD